LTPVDPTRRTGGLRWGAFAAELATAGRALLYQHGVGLAFLATVRRDGGPRLHPMCPLFTDDDLVAFIIPSPKRDDLHRDPRYAMHSFPAEENEDAFVVRGRAKPVGDDVTIQAVASRFAHERGLDAPPPEVISWELFAFELSAVLLTRTVGHGDPAPVHTTWRAG
jgi:pyridoxamine 5'-phosphate oxidase-like protein